MSPKQNSSSSRNSPMMQRRRQTAAAKAMAAAESSGADVPQAAGALSAEAAEAQPLAIQDQQTEEPQQELQLIGQELVPVQPVAPSPAQGSGSGHQAQPKETPSRQTQMSLECFQTPTPQGQSLRNDGSTPNSNVNTELVKVTKEVAVVPNGPSGPPVALGPPVEQQSPGPAVSKQLPALPLFTPEQFASLEQVHSTKLLGARLPMPSSMPAPMSMHAGGMYGGVHPGQMGLHHPGIDVGLQELHELRQRDLMWRAQMENHMEVMMLQLRASQSENLRLKQELSRRESSQFATPEEKKTASQSSTKEEGAVAQQDLFAGEDGTRVQQDCKHFEEDGTRVQQGRKSSKEDGTAVQQDWPQPERWVQVPACEPASDSEPSVKEMPPLMHASDVSDEEVEEKKEDGSADRQGKEASSFRPAAKRKDSNSEDTLAVVLQLMKGMQTMQQQLLNRETNRDRRREDEEEEVRVHVELHPLPEWSQDSAPVDFSDWLLLVSAQMSDLTSSSSTWWELIVAEARDWYRKHQSMKPLEKLKHSVKPSPVLQDGKWRRLEKRASTLLLKALPDQQKEDLIATKDLSVLGIVCRLMLNYQPGGGQEKQSVLNAIENPAEASNVSEAITGLRKWLRWKRRSEEIGVTLPDASVLLRALDKLSAKVLQGNSTLTFRMNLARTIH